MNYSTLQEAYNIDTFEKKSRPSQKPNKNNGNNGSMIASSNTSPAFTESSKLALSSNKLSDYPNNHGGSCAPLQAPNYNIPVSNQCKKEHDDAMNVYTNANNNTTMMNNMGSLTNNGMQSASPASQQGVSSQPSASLASANGSLETQGSLLPSSTTSSLNYSTNIFNNIKSSNDNVMPYYDEDLEQYFNISNLNDEVKYNSNNSTNAYMPNYNKQSYTNNDTTEYTNNTIVPKNGNNLLNNSSYTLTPEEKKSADEAIAYLKSIEDKINSGNINSSGYNKSSIADPVLPTNNTGPGGFKTPIQPTPVPTPSPTPTPTPQTPTPQIPPEKSDKTNYIYNAIFNISILLIIGIAIILLCDQMVELAIHIGMKRVVNILEPFLKNQVPVQELIQQVSN